MANIFNWCEGRPEAQGMYSESIARIYAAK